MKHLISKAITLFAFIAFMGGYVHAGNSIQAPSTWTNQSGSVLTIGSIDGQGQITGSYVNKASGYRCQNIPYPVTGWVYGSAITFTVKWQSSSESCSSITAWTGFLDNQGQIETLWQLVVNGSTSTNQILKGSDTFTQNQALEHKSLMQKK